jgi:hypothetical protein
MRRAIYILFIVLAAASAGCSSKKSASNGGGNNPPGYVPYTPTLPTLGGAEVTLTLDSKAALDSYMGWTSCAPVDAKVKIDLRKIAEYSLGNRGFGGGIAVSFTDQRTACGASANSTYTDLFSSMLVSTSYNTKKNDTENHIYNLASYNYPGMGGSIGYKGFFEQANVTRLIPPFQGAPIFGGAIILVIDSTNDLNDGSGPTSASGSIWYKNYIAQYPQGPIPNTNCWFISTGPYDCRSWPSGNSVDTMQSMTPNNGYQRLGTFTGLEIQKAFNNEI